MSGEAAGTIWKNIGKHCNATMVYIFILGLAQVYTPFAQAQALAAMPAFADPLDTSAVMVPVPERQPLIAIAQSGSNEIAAGPRGVIILSKDGGAHWAQANVPVESDLVAVQFYDSANLWACGHDGVILHSSDGGRNWVKLLDGNTAKTMFESYYQSKISNANLANHAQSAASISKDLQEIQLNFDPGPILPWMGIWFLNSMTGFAVGPFGNLAYSADGGKTWVPWLDHIDNPNFYDLNAIGTAGNRLYIVGEQGSVYLYDPNGKQFVARPTPYSGSLFGLTGDAKTLLVYGLRGSIFRSTDQGKTWTKSVNENSSTIMSGTELPDGRFVLVTVDGVVLVSSDSGVSFQTDSSFQNEKLSGVADGGKDLVMTSLNGIQHARIP